jgi:hypothetical protein
MVTGVITNAFGSKLPERGAIVASYLPLSHIYARFLDLVSCSSLSSRNSHSGLLISYPVWII